MWSVAALDGARRRGQLSEGASASSRGGLEGLLPWGPLVGPGATAVTENGVWGE